MPATPNLRACRQFEMYARSCPARNRIFSRAELQRFSRVKICAREMGRPRSLWFPSSAELPQMMVEVLVPQDGPLERCDVPEKAVRVCRAFFRASRRKAVDPVD